MQVAYIWKCEQPCKKSGFHKKSKLSIKVCSVNIAFFFLLPAPSSMTQISTLYTVQVVFHCSCVTMGGHMGITLVGDPRSQFFPSHCNDRLLVVCDHVGQFLCKFES